MRNISNMRVVCGVLAVQSGPKCDRVCVPGEVKSTEAKLRKVEGEGDAGLSIPPSHTSAVSCSPSPSHPANTRHKTPLTPR